MGKDFNNEKVKGIIEKVLDDNLEDALICRKCGLNSWPAVLLCGTTGIGKTARVESWAYDNKINLIHFFNSHGSVISKYNGITSEIAFCIKKQTSSDVVLFIDEYDEYEAEYNDPLFKLINEHIYVDENNNEEKLDFIFTVILTRPKLIHNYIVDEEIIRKNMPNVEYVCIKPCVEEIEHLKDYLINDKLKFDLEFDQEVYEESCADGNQKEKKYEEYILKTKGKINFAENILETKRKIKLVEYLFANNLIEIDDMTDSNHLKNLQSNKSWNNLVTVNRTLVMLLNWCDGTKENFLKIWNNFCNNIQKDKMIEGLKNYCDEITE